MTPVPGIQVSNDSGATWTHPLTAHPDPALEGMANMQRNFRRSAADCVQIAYRLRVASHLVTEEIGCAEIQYYYVSQHLGKGATSYWSP
jgi:hypothetical protein